MPIYEFKCNKCNERFDALLKSSDLVHEVNCPHCHSAEVERLMSAFGFRSGSTSVVSTGGSSSCRSCASKHCASCK